MSKDILIPLFHTRWREFLYECATQMHAYESFYAEGVNSEVLNTVFCYDSESIKLMRRYLMSKLEQSMREHEVPSGMIDKIKLQYGEYATCELFHLHVHVSMGYARYQKVYARDEYAIAVITPTHGVDMTVPKVEVVTRFILAVSHYIDAETKRSREKFKNRSLHAKQTTDL